MEWLRRLDEVAAELNVVLAIFAIGLAIVDLTFLLSQSVIDQLSTAGQVRVPAQVHKTP
jgi:hypothetical protein